MDERELEAIRAWFERQEGNDQISLEIGRLLLAELLATRERLQAAEVELAKIRDMLCPEELRERNASVAELVQILGLPGQVQARVVNYRQELEDLAVVKMGRKAIEMMEGKRDVS